MPDHPPNTTAPPPMKNCYAVVRVDKRGHDHLSAIYMTRTQAEEDVAAITTHPLIDWQVAVVEVSLSPVTSYWKPAIPTETTHQMERLEQEVRTLKTMVTALCGRVAEVSNAQAAK